MKTYLHTPEGVRDIYGSEYDKKETVQNNINHCFYTFGYQPIQTPMFEFFDVFGSEIGTTPSKDLYKFFDKEGNTLVLRPDFTPSIGRCTAKYFMEDNRSVRLCYKGNTFVNTSNLQGKLKEVTQMGVELIGDDSVFADAEMIHLSISSLKAAGLKEFQISIGQIEYFKGMCQAASLDEEIQEDLRKLISNKNYFAAEELLKEKQIPEDKINTFLRITDLFGSYEILDEALSYVDNEQSKDAIYQLKELYELLKIYGDEQYISFDLGFISKFHYYTGIIFKGYTYGLGEEILSGGRYNNLLSFFGKNSPSIGFVITIDGLLQALNSKKLVEEAKPYLTVVVYEKEMFENAVRYANEMRMLGNAVELICRKEDEDLKELTSNLNTYTTKSLVYINEKGTKTFY